MNKALQVIHTPEYKESSWRRFRATQAKGERLRMIRKGHIIPAEVAGPTPLTKRDGVWSSVALIY